MNPHFMHNGVRKTVRRVSVKGVILDQISDMPFIILQTEDRKKTVSLGVGPAEATAIIMALEGIKATRPLTHDLFAHFLKRHGFSVEKIDIYGMNGNKYFTKLYYRKGLRHFKMELRPSDALALAVRLETPIYIKKEFIDAQADFQNFADSDRYYRGDVSLFDNRNDFDFSV